MSTTNYVINDNQRPIYNTKLILTFNSTIFESLMVVIITLLKLGCNLLKCKLLEIRVYSRFDFIFYILYDRDK